MQEKHLYEYAVIRIVPKVEREEFLNVGVILYCPKHRFLQLKYNLDDERLKAFCKESDIQGIEAQLVSFDRICKGESLNSPISKLPIAARFRWLTAVRSTVVQASKVHPGLCTEPEVILKMLFNQLVG